MYFSRGYSSTVNAGHISSLDPNSKRAIWNNLVPKTHFATDFRAEKGQEELRRKTNDRRCPIKLGPRTIDKSTHRVG